MRLLSDHDFATHLGIARSLTRGAAISNGDESAQIC